LNLYHDGSNSYIENTLTGHFLIRNQSHGSKIHFGTENSDGVLEYALNVTGTHSVGIGTSITGDDKLLVMGNVGVTGSLSVSSSIKSITGNYTGNVSGALGNTGSFDRLEGVTLNASISPFASGSDVSQIQAQTGSYASGSDLHQFLAESASYLVDADTGSLGLLTLGNNITGSITSTASFGSILTAGNVGIGTTSPGSALHIRKDSAADQLRLGRVDDNSYLSIGAGATHAVYNMVTAGTISHQFQEDGSAKMTITTAGGVGIGSTTPNDDKLLVAGNAGITGDLNVSGSITANEYIINSSVTNVTQSFSSGSTIFGDSIDDTHKFTGSLSVSGGLSFPLSSSTITFDGEDGNTQITAPNDNQLQLKVKGVQGINIFDSGVVINEGSQDYNFRVETNNDSRTIFADGGRDNVSIGYNTAAFDEKFLVAGNTGITGSLNVSGSITSNQTPNVHSLSGSLHVSGGIGGTLHLSSSTSTPMIQFHQSSSDAAVLLQTDEYGADLWKVIEFSEKNHSGLLIGQHFNTATGDTIRVRAGGNGDCDVEHHLGDSSFMVTDLGDTTTAHAKIDSSGLTTSGSVTASNGATIGNTETGSFTLSELNVIGTGLGLSLGTTSGTAGIRIRDNRASNNSAVVQRSDGRLSLAGTENSWGSSGIEITSTGRVAVGGTTFGRNDGSLIERFLVHGSAGITGSLHTSGSITTQANISGSITSTGSFGALSIGHGTPDRPLRVYAQAADSNVARFSHGSANGAVDVYSGTDGGLINVRNGSGTSVIELDARNNRLLLADNISLKLGTGGDLFAYHDGSHTLFRNNTGHLYIDQLADDSDIILRSDDGSGGTTPYMALDGGSVIVTMHVNQRFDDSKKLILGGGSDLHFYHDGSDTYMENYTGDLHIKSTSTTGDIKFQSGSTTYIELDVSTERVDIKKPLNVEDTARFTDGSVLYFGDNNDLRIQHNGSNSFIQQYGTGDLYIDQTIDDKDIILRCDDGSGGTTAYITLDGSLSLNVLNTNTRVPDSVIIGFGNSSDLQIYHNGTNSFGADNYTGHLIFQNRADDQDIIFKNDDGAGGEAAYITLDGSTTDLSLTPPGITHLLEANTGTPASTYAAPLSASLVIEDDATPTKNSIVIKTHNVGEDNVIGALKFVSSPDGANYNWNGIEAIAGASGQAQDLVFYTSDSNTGGVTSTERLRITENQISGSITSTGSFGRIEADSYNLATLSEVSGGLSSTGSFGQLIIQKFGSAGASYTSGYNSRNTAIFDSNNSAGTTISITTKNTGYSGIFFGDQDNTTTGLLKFDNADNSLSLVTNGSDMFKVDSSGNFTIPRGNLGVSGSINVSGSVLPVGDNNAIFDLGSSSKRWNDVFAVQTTVGAVFETGLRSKGIGKEETGTIVVWRNGKLVPCDTSEDTMVMGVVKQGKDEPIVMGAEPVLVTGDVKEGDFITTSTKLGHGKKIESGYLLKKEMFGKVIAQALENASGNSSLIKCMIRKM